MKDLILVPGLGSDAAVWSRTVAMMGGGIATMVGDTLQDTSLEDMARRILDGAPAQFCLAGVSMGGMVALEIMRLASDRVRALALVDTNVQPDTQEQVTRRLRSNEAVLAAKDLRVLGAAALEYLIHTDAGEDVRQELIQMTIRVGAEVYARQNLAVLQRRDLRPVLSTIEIPTQVIVGAEDRMTPVALSEAIHRAVAHSELHIIPSCGHLPPIEKPQIMAMQLMALIAQTS